MTLLHKLVIVSQMVSERDRIWKLLHRSLGLPDGNCSELSGLEWASVLHVAYCSTPEPPDWTALLDAELAREERFLSDPLRTGHWAETRMPALWVHGTALRWPETQAFLERMLREWAELLNSKTQS